MGWLTDLIQCFSVKLCNHDWKFKEVDCECWYECKKCGRQWHRGDNVEI